jgi:hypothetical protein
MRSIIKMLGLAFFATLAFSAVGAIGAGSASALLFLTTTSNAEELFTVKGLGNAVLELATGTEVKCKVTSGHGFLLKSTNYAHKILLTFHECTSPLGECNSAGEPKGLIKTLELVALLVRLLEPLARYGLKVLAEKGNLADFNCGILNTSVVVKGAVVGEFEETLTQSRENNTERKLVFEKGSGAGVPFITDYWTLQGVGTAKLETSIGAAAFRESNEQVLVDINTKFNGSFCG